MAPCSSEYEGRLAAAVYDPAERAALKSHLATCAGCRQELDDLTRAARSIGAGPVEITQGERADLMRAILNRVENAPRPRITARVKAVPATRGWGFGLAMAAGILLTLGGVFLLRQTQQPVPVEIVAEPKTYPVAVPPKPPEMPQPRIAPAPEKPVPLIPAPGKPAVAEVPTPKPEAPAAQPIPEPPAPKPVEPVAPKATTVAVMAEIEKLHGDVAVITENGRLPAKVGTGLIPGQEIRVTGRSSFAALKVTDGTRILLSTETAFKLVSDRGAETGRSFFVEKGIVHADVAKQPANQPLVFVTPGAEAKVIGTELTLNVTPTSTRLEVSEGKVRLTRREDNATVDVGAGLTAVATKGAPMAVRMARASSGLEALYLFNESQGNTVHDVSGSGAPLDLRITRPGNVKWTTLGLNVQDQTRIDSEVPAAKIIDACRKSNELTLETWITPAKTALDFEGAIVSIGTDVQDRNVALVHGDTSMGLHLYTVTPRTSNTDAGGRPEFFAPKNSVETKLTHVVFTRAASGVEKLYLNGVERAARLKPGTFAPWNDAFRFILANEATEERPWIGIYRLVAVYSRALSPAEVARNLKAGVE